MTEFLDEGHEYLVQLMNSAERIIIPDQTSIHAVIRPVDGTGRALSLEQITIMLHHVEIDGEITLVQVPINDFINMVLKVGPEVLVEMTKKLLHDERTMQQGAQLAVLLSAFMFRSTTPNEGDRSHGDQEDLG